MKMSEALGESHVLGWRRRVLPSRNSGLKKVGRVRSHFVRIRQYVRQKTMVLLQPARATLDALTTANLGSGQTNSGWSGRTAKVPGARDEMVR